MNNYQTHERATTAVANSSPALEVAIGELSEALKLELRSLEFRRSVIQHQKKRSSLRHRDHHGGKHTGADTSAADPIAEQARHNLRKAETDLQGISSEIETHNAALNRQNMIIALLLFIPNYLRGGELAQRRARALRRYQHAKSDWQAISVTMQRQSPDALRNTVRHSNSTASSGNTQVSLLEERKLSILLSFLVSEITTRKHLQSLLVGIPADIVVPVCSRDLDLAIRDSALKQRLVSLRERRQQRLR